MIYLGADHRGFKAKEKLKSYLQKRGYKLTDVGTDSEESVDYPVIAERVARNVIGDPNNRGVVLCGSGAGVCIVANKLPGIRAAEAWNEAIVKAARNDDNVNILCLAADFLNEVEMKKITQVFLDTSFSGEERYKRRLKKITEIEKDY